MEWVRSSWSGHEIGERHRLAAVRTRSTWTDALAESLAVRAALLPEVARLALGADVHGGEPRGACGEGRLRQHGVTAAPGGLPTRRATEPLAAHTLEVRAAPGAGRLAIVTQRLHPDLVGGCAGVARACGGNEMTRSRFR